MVDRDVTAVGYRSGVIPEGFVGCYHQTPSSEAQIAARCDRSRSRDCGGPQ